MATTCVGPKNVLATHKGVPAEHVRGFFVGLVSSICGGLVCVCVMERCGGGGGGGSW